MKEVLKVKNISKKYQAENGEVEALKDAQIINQGEIIDEQLPRMTKLAEELKAEKEEEKK